MRIIKYLFLLFLLSLVALTIYIATQKGNFTVKSSKVINSPKATVFGYVNDYKNWQKFSSWIISDKDIKLSYSPTTTGNGSTLAWEGNSDIGNIETIYTKGNDSIVQKMEYNGTSSDVFLSFKDTVGGTKVTWKSVGKMDFMLKVNSFFSGGTQNKLSKVYDKCLANLDKTLDFENTTFNVKINGIVQKLETFYLKESFTSKISNITRNANVVFPKIITFCKQNNIPMNGRPFIIYHTYDTINDLTKVSFCIPIKEQIFTSEGSEILAGKLVAFEALKTSLTGNYTYKNKALAKTTEYTTNKHILTGTTFSHLEIFTIGKNESLSPSKWLTDIYFPIKPKVIPKPYRKVVRDSTVTAPAPATHKSQEESEF
ncbi:SRPBCC family protein [Flavobacterium granuli]|uniref:Effector-binding domain-containing protein n=1 Tax=Flavobacterium granuli TaxID=280093 RepID=A0ABU1RXL7_9FLAO|nr:SRPBCC family protein [Flavobacterium granuli]MDR6843504.1 effector-binding domain-containing protein [Flavobacterium granuli]